MQCVSALQVNCKISSIQNSELHLDITTSPMGSCFIALHTAMSSMSDLTLENIRMLSHGPVACRVSEFLRSRTSGGLRGLRTMNRTASMEPTGPATPPATRPALSRSLTSPAPAMVRLTASSGDQILQAHARAPEDAKIPASRQRPIVNASVATARALAPNGQPRKVCLG